ncbi:sensor histidine kinase [Priestia endophytica]|uniref:sensor histidine kinase n=1 Tax=Priestia endophytica TaxID=135735 RepID=UPI0022805A52|nr:ATP-binding protein [Priestia endophytica]MCY8233933.1 HAMP domain-containing histidine kinase [Priestia endophytica]
MKINFLSRIRNVRKRRERDLFKSTQARLTLLYSGLLILFLIAVVTIVYLVFYTVNLNGQKHELGVLVRRETNLVEDYLRENGREAFQNRESQDLIVADYDRFFYYITDPQGNLLVGDEMVPPLRNQLTDLVKNWTPKHNEIRQAVVQVKDMRDKEILNNTPPDFTDVQEVRLMITGQPIYYQGQLIGILYMGKNISFVYDSFKRLPILLIGIIILFAGVAVYISYLMSKKAMIPITRAFSRQKEFAADASHELRTPLSVLLSSINAIEMVGTLNEKDYAQKLLGTMKEEVKRMTKLVSALLTLARSDSGLIERADEIFDFRPAVENTVHSIETLAKRKQIKLHLQAPNQLLIRGDSERLTQLLYILLDNAVKYTPNGGEVYLTLSIESSSPQMFQMIVQDTGIGIAPESYDLIFARFYREDKARSKQIAGHGLGLSIAKLIVDVHQGTIEVSSELNKGSTFKVQIPFSVKPHQKAEGKIH